MLLDCARLFVFVRACVCLSVCASVIILAEQTHEYGLYSRAGEEPSCLGLRSKPPVVLSFSHFVTGCCANGFYDPGPFCPSPSSSSALPSLPADHYLGLLYCSALGW